MVKKIGLFFLLVFHISVYGQREKIRRVIIKEYFGGTFLPTKTKNESTLVELYRNKGYLKISLIDYRGEMNLIHYSNDSIILEKGHYINSVKIFKQKSFFYSGDGNGSGAHDIEYYEPRRNGKWFFCDSLGVLNRTEFYISGILCADSTKEYRN